MAAIIGKKEMVDHIAQKGDLTKKIAETALNAFTDVIIETLGRGDSVRIIPFGSFDIRKRSARVGRNPKTGEEIKISARKVPVFKPGKALKDLIK